MVFFVVLLVAVINLEWALNGLNVQSIQPQAICSFYTLQLLRYRISYNDIDDESLIPPFI